MATFLIYVLVFITDDGNISPKNHQHALVNRANTASVIWQRDQLFDADRPVTVRTGLTQLCVRQHAGQTYLTDCLCHILIITVLFELWELSVKLATTKCCFPRTKYISAA